MRKVLFDVESYAYLRAVLTRLPESRVDRIAELLPFDFRPPGCDLPKFEFYGPDGGAARMGASGQILRKW